jgi:nitrite reductase (NO-forming)
VISRAMVLALAFVSLGAVSAVQAQEQFSVDAAQAAQGAKVWKSKSCDGCHTIGKGKRAGPDLAGVTSRRTSAWLAQWLKDPPAMAKTDPDAKEMVKEAKGMVMPDMRLSEEQVQGLIHYMAAQSGSAKT